MHRTRWCGPMVSNVVPKEMKKRHIAVMLSAGVLVLLFVVANTISESFSIRTFERNWTRRLAALAHPEELNALAEQHGPGDHFVNVHSSGTRIAAVSASSCGNGHLPDLVLIRDSLGNMYKIEDEYCCGRGGIAMGISEVHEPTLAAMHVALARNTNCSRIREAQRISAN